MRGDEGTEAVTIQASKDVLSRIDALAVATDRSRNEVVDDALRLLLEANDWQIARIEEGLAAARDGRVRPAEDVLAELAAKHGYER